MNRAAATVLIVLLFPVGSYAAFLPQKQSALSEKIAKAVARQNYKVGYVFIDDLNQTGIQISGTSEFPAASVAKVAVMAAAFSLAREGKIDLSQKVLFCESDKLGGSGILQWLKGGTEYSLWNLIRMMIVLSDNTATRLVVETVGKERINNYLSLSGFNKTRITDPTMLAEPPSSEVNLTSPNDMARLLLKIKNSPEFSRQDKKEMLSFLKNQRYRWGIWRGVPGGVVVADKTGNLEGILNDVGIVYAKCGDYILSIFTWGCPKQRDARLLINELSKITYEEYTGELVRPPGKKMLKKQVIKRRLSHPPSAKFRRRSSHRG